MMTYARLLLKVYGSTKARAMIPLISLSDLCGRGSNPDPSNSLDSFFWRDMVKTVGNNKDYYSNIEAVI